MTELSLKWKQIFNEISTADEHIVGKINYYNLASILEDLYVENAELKERIEKLEKWKSRVQKAGAKVSAKMKNVDEKNEKLVDNSKEILTKTGELTAKMREYNDRNDELLDKIQQHIERYDRLKDEIKRQYRNSLGL